MNVTTTNVVANEQHPRCVCCASLPGRRRLLFLCLLAALPAFAQSVQEHERGGVMTGADTADTLDAVTVTGFRGSIQSAQLVKQDAVQIVDVVMSDDLGKLPDITASASLARITGVQVSRAAGEAAEVRVRGLPDLATTYNGREIFTTFGRNVEMQDFPAGGIAGIDVYKSSTAELVEGGIAGLINVRSRRPFDFAGRELSGTFNQVYLDQSDKSDLNVNLVFSDRWQTRIGEMGFLINVTRTRLRFLDSTREHGLDIGVAQPEQTDVPGFRFPNTASVYYGEGKRTRPSVNAAFQWRPNERWELTADALFQGYRGRDSDHNVYVPLFDANTQFTDVITVPGQQAPQAVRLTATGGQRPAGFQSSLDAKTNTYQVGIGAVYRNDGWTWSADVAWTDSAYTPRWVNIDYAYASTPVREVVFDVGGGDGGPTFQLRDFDPMLPDNYLFSGLYERNYRSHGEDIQARTDVEFAPESGAIAAIQGGVRFNKRNVDRRNSEYYEFVEPQQIPLASLPVDFIRSAPGFDDDRYAPLRSWYTPEYNSMRRNVRQLRALVGRPGDGPLFGEPTFVGEETTSSAYAQIRYELDGGIPVDGALGVRAVRTETDISGRFDGEWVTRGNSYTDVLPNASLRLRFIETLQLRLAATKTRTRPRFFDLNPATTFNPLSGTCLVDPRDANCVRGGSGGNPALKPLESKNYDISLEYYFSEAGAATLGLFRREVSGFISTTTVDLSDPVYNRVRISRPENGGEGRLQGVEAAFTAFLNWDVLPEWANAFGMQANYTYIDHGSEPGPSVAASLPGRPRIPGVSKNNMNLVLLYERPVFSGRLAYNWRSKWVEGYYSTFDPALNGSSPALPAVLDDYGTLDLALNWTPVPKWTVAFDVSNILGNPLKWSRQYNVEGDDYRFRVKYLERLFSLGIRFRF